MSKRDHWDEETLDDHAVPPRSLAEYHARWLLERHGFAPPLTFEQVETLALREGMEIIIDPRCEEEGIYRNHPFPHAVLRRPDAHTAGHELGHHRWHGQKEYAVELYATWWKATGEERFCEDFADCLTRAPGEIAELSCGYRSDWDEPGAEEFWGPEG